MFRIQSNIMAILLLLLLTLLIPQVAHAETAVEAQTIDSRVTWTLSGSPYKVTGNVIVSETGTLAIEPGVVVEMGAEINLTVDGRFAAQGTDSSRIVFKWAVEGVHWGSLYFSSSSSPANVLSNCKVTGASRINIQSNLTVSNNTVEQNSGYGVYINSSSPTIRNNNIGLNTGYGIYIHSGNPVIENNLITDNGDDGIYVSASSYPVIQFNTVDANGRGIYFVSDNSVAVVKNNIVTNNVTGIRNDSSEDGGHNNVWNNNTDYSSATAATTDISVDPLYADYWSGNFHLQDDSPCKTASKDKTEIGAYAGVDGEIGIYGIGPYDPVPVEVTLTSPNTAATYYAGDTVTITWETINADPSDNMIVSMKRDAVAGTLTEPNDVDWYRFIENTENDGSEEVTIPSSVADAEDWRFYVKHTDSDVSAASDENFTVTTICSVTVTKAGGGTGTVTSDPDGMNCGTDCSEQEAVYTCGTEITLTATPDKGYVFSGWSGHCTGKDACTLTAEGTIAVTAFFTPPTQIIGDVNGDGEITPGDAVAAYELSKKFSWTEAELIAADFNGDGEITPQDAVSIYEKSKEF